MQEFLVFLLKSFNKLISAVILNSQQNFVYTFSITEDIKYILSTLIFYLRNHTLSRYNMLTELTVIDTPSSPSRFTLVLFLTSIEFSNKLSLVLPLSSTSTPSFVTTYPNSNWCEREVRDMFGVYFTNNQDLRRLLTDYGFEGFPLRKDFPLTGYLEVRYDDEIQRIIYEPVELAQEFRVFQVSSPWEIKSYKYK